MNKQKTIIYFLLIGCHFFYSCKDDVTIINEEGQNFTPNKSWNETVVTKNRQFQQSYTKNLDGLSFSSFFDFGGENDSLEIDITIYDDNIEEGKVYNLGNAVDTSFIDNVTWQKDDNGFIRYKSISGSVTITDFTIKDNSNNGGIEPFWYISGNYETLVVFNGDTVELNGQFKDIFLKN